MNYSSSFNRKPHPRLFCTLMSFPFSDNSLSRSVAYLGLQPSTLATSGPETVAVFNKSSTARINSSSVYRTAKRALSFVLGRFDILVHHVQYMACCISTLCNKLQTVNYKYYLHYTAYCKQITNGCLQDALIHGRYKMDLFGMWEDNLLPKCRPRNQRSDLYTVQESNFGRNTNRTEQGTGGCKCLNSI